MLAITVRVKYLKIATAAVLFAILLAMAVLAVLSAGVRDEHRNASLSSTERVAFLNQCGWLVEGERWQDVRIPSEFNAAYTEYNRIQKKQGYNLEKYKGTTVREYTYNVTNYPHFDENVVAHLLVYNGRVIGGDVSSMEVNGFMQGLDS